MTLGFRLIKYQYTLTKVGKDVMAWELYSGGRHGIHSTVIKYGDRDRDKEATWIHDELIDTPNNSNKGNTFPVKNAILKQCREIEDGDGHAGQGEAEDSEDSEAPTLLQQIQSQDQYKTRTNNKITSIRGRLGDPTPEKILEDMDSWDLQYKRQGDGSSVRVKECPMCHPIKGRLDNMYALVVNLKDAVFFCHRCGSKGHWAQMKRFMDENGMRDR